jgi:serine/threonine protein kinase
MISLTLTTILYFFIITQIDNIDEESQNFREDAILKDFIDYPYCIVMEAGDLNLKQHIDRSNISNDWIEIRSISHKVLSAIKHIHEQSIIHCDIKPMNIMIVGQVFKLIDLDASAKMDTEFSGSKFSSLYSPPELLYKNINNENNIELKTFTIDYATGKPINFDNYELVPAKPSHDMWAIGILIYYMLTGTPIFLANNEGNLTNQQDLKILFDWKDTFKSNKINQIIHDNENELSRARNFISLLLMKDPSKRLTALIHPFITGIQPTRMQGEKGEYDLFLSYRVKDDLIHVEKFYNQLKSLGLNVWWDKKCLKDGENWEQGFCDGLVSSDNFICILSKGALSNLPGLKEDSNCDNLLLEWQLAEELKERRMIEKKFPIFIGDNDGSDNYCDYFKTNCHPSLIPGVLVDKIQSKFIYHLNRQSLGNAYRQSYKNKVNSIVSDILLNQGYKLEGNIDKEVIKISNNILLSIDTPDLVNHCRSLSARRQSSLYSEDVDDDRIEFILEENIKTLTIQLDKAKKDYEEKDKIICEKDEIICSLRKIINYLIEKDNLRDFDSIDLKKIHYI